jgi:hypothetical protein
MSDLRPIVSDPEPGFSAPFIELVRQGGVRALYVEGDATNPCPSFDVNLARANDPLRGGTHT